MTRHSRFIVLSGVLLFVLLLSLGQPMAVSADDGAPPPPASEEVQPPAEEGEQTADSGSPIADGEGQETAEEPAITDEVTVAETLELAPEGAQVVVLDENGATLPLVSTEAAEIVAGSDPMWCPAGQVPGDLGCTDSYTTVTELIANLGGKTGAGTIYFTPTYNVDDATFDPGTYKNLAGLTDLTLQGGWNGATGAGYGLSGVTTFSVPLTVSPWVGNVTIKDITITGTGATGLVVQTQGDITLSNVDANGNASMGAELQGGGNIDIRSSTFGGGAGNGNVFMGLFTSTVGSTTLVDVTASGNGIFGATLTGPLGFGGPITVSESHFDENGALGLLVTSSSITLSNVTVSDNGGVFVELAGANLLGDGPITVTESHFDRNDSGGLLVVSNGEVSLSGVTANGNAFYGVDVGAAGSVWVSHSYFDGNTDPLGEAFGLAVGSDLDITLDHVSTSNNEGAGAFLSTFENATVVCSQFQNNANVGVDGWYVDGTFTLNDVTFGGNGLDYDGTPVFMSGGCKVVVKGTETGTKPKSERSLPLHIVPVGGGEKVDLDCRGYSGTKLILPNGDNVILYCPVLDDAYLTALTLQGLATLPGGFTFVSGMEVKVTKAGNVRTSVGPNVVVTFVVPEDKIGSNFVILHWDGSAWTELGGSGAGGSFSVETSLAGVFVLAIK